MKSRFTTFTVVAIAGLLPTAPIAETKTTVNAPAVQQAIRYNFEYKCTGETVVISHCRIDSDRPGYPATRPEENYCQVYYPDRPKRNGFTAMATELRSDVVRQLQACGALGTSQPTGTRPTASAGTGAEAAIDVWQRTISKTDSFVGKDDFAIIFTSPTRHYIYCRGVITNDGKPYTVERRDGRIVVTLAAATPWSLALQPDGSLISLSVHTFAWESGKRCAVDALRPTARTPGAKIPPPRASTGNGAEAYVAEGNRYAAAKDYGKAIEAYKKAIAIDPKLWSAQKGLDSAYYNLKQYDKAVAPLREAVRIKPNDANANFGLGFSYYEVKQYSNALAAFREAVRLKPSDAESHYWVGEVYLVGLNQSDKAIPAFRESLRLRPNDARTIGELGVAYYNLRQYPDALVAFKESIRLKPQKAEPHFALGLTYLAMGKKEDAQQVSITLQGIDKKKAEELDYEILASVAAEALHPEKTNTSGNPASGPTSRAGRRERQARGASPVQAAPGNPSGPRQPNASGGTSAEACRAQGEKYRAAKDYARAIQSYKKAIALDPSLSDAHYGLAATYDDQGQYKLAIASYRQVLALKPDFANGFTMLGNAHRRLKQYGEALKALRRAIALKPDPVALASAHFFIGVTYDELEQYEKAVLAFQEAVRLEPDYDQNHFHLGVAYARLKQSSNALRALQHAIRLKPDHELAHYWLGTVYRRMQQYEKASVALREAVRLNPDHAEAHQELGSAYFGLNQNANAVAALKQAIRLKPNDVLAHYGLGLTYVVMGQKADALQIYRRLNSIDKTAAQTLLAEINKMK